MSEAAIFAENLTRYFGDVPVVNNVSLSIPAGTVFGFLGPNGAGKTTTIRLLLGLLEPTNGRAEVLGFDTRSQADQIRTSAGALLEHSGLYERLSAEDNLELFARIWSLSHTDRAARIKELLVHLDLWDRRKETVATWSRGMKQKLAVARALLHRPRVLFLDEPTAGLDPVATAALREDLAALVSRENVTVFLTTHNLVEAEKLCALIGVIRQGKLLTVGHPDELRTGNGAAHAEIVGRGFTEEVLARLNDRPEVASASLQNGRLIIDLNAGSAVAPLVSLLVHSGAEEVEEVRKGTASLEEVFLSLMEEAPA